MKRKGHLLTQLTALAFAALTFAALLWVSSGYAFQNPTIGSKNENSQPDEKDKRNILARTVRKVLAPRQARIFGRPYTYYFFPIAFYHFETGLNLKIFLAFYGEH